MSAGFPRLYAILSTELIRTPLPNLALTLAQAGVGLIQCRNKRATTRELLEVSRETAGALAGHATRFIVNDRPDIAVLAGAGGVHVGQDDLPVEAARAVARTAQHGDFWVGVSTHNLEQLRAADKTSADYVAIGPISSTATKENHDPAVGVEFVRQARAVTAKPLVAIGGITLSTAGDIFHAGADCVAVARDLICADDPAARAGEYLAVAERYCAPPSHLR
jgi:thiamine-phosphate pyrophosphorylase